MGKLEDARQPLEDSLSLDPQNYQTIIELLSLLAKLRDQCRTLEVTALLLRLDPHNPTVFNDCFNFAAGWIERTELLKLIDSLKSERSDDQLVQASCDFYAGHLLAHDEPAAAKRRYISAAEMFRRILPRNHHVFDALRFSLKRCS